ncbi:hypothetical protein ACQ4PT_019790 [Festuca glaucescens]
MEEPSNPGGGGGHGGGRSVVSAGGGGVASLRGESAVDDLDKLWPSRPSSAAAILAQIWVDHLANSERFTHGVGVVDFNSEIWEVRIHLDGVDNMERKIGRDDITYMNIVAMIENLGYSIRDSIYCRQSDGKDRRAVVAKKQSYASHSSGTSAVGVVVKYAAPVVYDFGPPVVYAVDTESQVFTSQTSSTASFGNPHQCTQESTNLQKGKAIQIAENVDDAIFGVEDDGDGSIFFDMGEADFAAMEEIRRKEDMDITEKIEEMRRKREDPMLHCEGDTDIEDIYVTTDDNEHEFQAALSHPNFRNPV